MSSVKIVENITQVTNGKPVPVLEFVRQYKSVAAAVSKATPGTDRVARDSVGNRKLVAPDFASITSIHRSISRRNKDAKMTFQMLPDLKLSLEMVVSLIMSPKDLFSDEVLIRSDSLDLLPASLMQSMLQVVTDYFRKNYDLSEFLQHMLEQTLGYQGALPVAIIPENALDDLINNYNSNVTLESFAKEFDIERNIPHPIDLLGVPDYLSAQGNKKPPVNGRLRFGSDVSFSLESFDRYRGAAGGASKPSTGNAAIAFSKLMPAPEGKPAEWKFGTAVSNESMGFDADQLVFVTDNMAALKVPSIKSASLDSRVDEVLNKKGYNKLQVSMESIQETFKKKMLDRVVTAEGEDLGRVPTDAEVEALIFKNRRFAHTPVASIRANTQLKRNSIGEAMVKFFDTACFIPASVEGDPTRKLGGYVLLDEEGNPLSTYGSDPDEVVDLSSYGGGSGNFVSSMNERSNSVMNGKNMNDVPSYMLKKFFTNTFGTMVEKDIVDRVKNGKYTGGVQLGSNEDFYWLMLTRCMKGQRTQLLWIPAEYLVYFAMDYDELGFGKSLLDDIRNITSMRIMLMVAGIAASLRNSIGRTKVTIKLDEEDQDAGKTIEDIQDEILKSRMNPIPFGVNNVADISKYLQRSCYEFEISGSSALPDMQIGFDQYNTQYPKPDEELQSQLKDLSIQHFSLTRDMIDAAEGVEFAIQAATNNLLTMKRVMRWQRKVTPQATEFVRKVSLHSDLQITQLREIVTNNFDQLQVQKLKNYFGIEDEALFKDADFKKLVVEQCLNAFINNLTVELPSPAATTLDAQKEMFEAAADFYKTALEYIVNESFFDTSIQGEGLSDHVDMIKNILLSHYMRDYMAKNGILPELAELTTLDEDGKVGMNVMDSLEKHIKALGMSTGNFFERFKEFSIKQTAVMQGVGEGSTSGETDTGGGGGGSDSGGGGGDDFGGSMDEEFGGSDDPLDDGTSTGTDDAPTDDNPGDDSGSSASDDPPADDIPE
jgi:uncharacterized membrane protein YgcG